MSNPNSSSQGRYDRHDFGSPRAIKSANYDRLRDAGIDRGNAARIAARSVEKTQRKIDQGAGFDAAKKAREQRGPQGTDAELVRSNPFRVRFDWETEDAGITLPPTPAPR